MAPFSNEAVKSILADVNKFVSLTLKSESLSKKAESERTKLVEALEKFFADNYSLSPHSGDEESTSTSSHKTPSISGSIDDSKNTGDSHGSEEDYDDNIPLCNVKSLENATKYGYLDYKKQREGQILPSSWQKKRYFVLHKRIMYCYKKPSDQKQYCAFLVSGYDFQESPQHTKDSKRKDCCFELTIPGKKSHQFLADSKEDLQAWRKVLQDALYAETPSSREDLFEEEDDDLYEPLPGDGDDPPTSRMVQSAAPPVQIKLEEVDADLIEEEEEDIYEEGTSNEPAVSATVAPQPSPSSKTAGGIFSKFFKSKDSKSAEKKEKTEDAKPKEEEAGPPLDIEFEEDDEIYDFVDVDNAQQPPPPPSPRPVPPTPAASPANPEKDEPPPKSPSITSAMQAPTNGPRLPSRGPVPVPVSPPTTPTPALPPRVPPSSQPPPLPERDLPPLPERDLPPLPQRNLPPRPPNIPVPPIPSDGPKGPQALQPRLDESIGRPRDEDFENLYYGAYTCHGASESELTFSRGDIIHVVSRDLEPHNWWVGELSGKIGLVPKTYLLPAFTEVN